MGKQTFQITLYSGSQKQYVISNTNLCRCVYQINWDALYRGANVGGKTANVYVQMRSNNIAKAGTVAATTGNIYLLELPSPNSVSPDVGGVNVAVIQTTGSSNVSTEAGYTINIDTTAQLAAPQVILPNGTGQLTVYVANEDGTQMDVAQMATYQLTLFFVVDEDD